MNRTRFRIWEYTKFYFYFQNNNHVLFYENSCVDGLSYHYMYDHPVWFYFRYSKSKFFYEFARMRKWLELTRWNFRILQRSVSISTYNFYKTFDTYMIHCSSSLSCDEVTWIYFDNGICYTFCRSNMLLQLLEKLAIMQLCHADR